MIRYISLLTTLAVALPAVAQQRFSAPDGCQPQLTVQQKSCVMVNVWTCEADNPGDQWIGLIGQNGLFSVQKVDAEFQWLEAYRINGNERLITPPADAASLTELFDTQLDTWDFVIETDDGDERNVGFDMLTGETTTIDGELLLNTQYQGRTINADGVEIHAGSGRQFVSEKHRLFFFGESWEAATPDVIVDMSPVEFIYPGEIGFFTDQPKFECNVVETRLQQ